MRVALITDGIWPYVLGGMQKHSYYLCKYLAQNKVEVDLFHFNQSNYDITKLEFFSAEELKYIHATVIDFPKSIPFPGHYIYNSYRYSKLVFEAVKNKIKANDFIYTKGFSGWYLIDQKHSRKIDCAPVGVKFHGYEMFQQSPSFKIRLQHLFLLRRPVRSISLKADLVFSYGGKITGIIRSIGVPREKIIELPSGVERSVLAEHIVPLGDTTRFLFLGRYERRKGIEELNEALGLLFASPQIKKCEFHFIGPIPDDKKLKNPAAIYHGEVRDKKILQSLISTCDILICPSWSEGMPNVILEAMANGLAVMATDVGATNVLVNAHTGWLLNAPPVPREIKSTLESVLKLPAEVIDQKKQNALNLVAENFVWEKLVLQLMAVFEKLSAKK